MSWIENKIKISFSSAVFIPSVLKNMIEPTARYREDNCRGREKR